MAGKESHMGVSPSTNSAVANESPPSILSSGAQSFAFFQLPQQLIPWHREVQQELDLIQQRKLLSCLVYTNTQIRCVRQITLTLDKYDNGCIMVGLGIAHNTHEKQTQLYADFIKAFLEIEQEQITDENLTLPSADELHNDCFMVTAKAPAIIAMLEIVMNIVIDLEGSFVLEDKEKIDKFFMGQNTLAATAMHL